jgi:hypothetical protein
MRLIAPGGRTPPREVNKYLLLHEHQVITHLLSRRRTGTGRWKTQATTDQPGHR